MAVKLSMMVLVITLAMATATVAAEPVEGQMLKSEDINLQDWQLTVKPLGQTVEIDPLTLKSYTHQAELPAGTPGWRGPLLLPGPAWAYRALREETLEVTLADDDQKRLQRDKDFALDVNWAAVAALEGGSVPVGTKIKLTYKYGLSRIDLVELTPEGKLVVVKGTEDKSQPPMPAPTPGNKLLATVYLPNYARCLTMDMVNLVDPDYDGVPPVIGSEHLQKVRQKLKDGQATTIVFFGDSITAQQMKDFRDGKGSFVDRFVTYLKETYPQADVVLTSAAEPVAAKAGQIVVVKAGVGGSDTRRAVGGRLEREVLPHKADLVVIMFGVNDENRTASGGNSVPVDQYKANLEKMVDELHAAGSQALIMTTSMKNLGWTSTVGNLDAYAAAARQVAADKKLCLVDNFAAWQQLPKRGYNYMVLLGNCINHPVDVGHEIFFSGLKAALEADSSE